MLRLITLLPLVLVASASPLLDLRADKTAQADLNVANATWDGKCYYPTPDPQFDLTKYVGKWFQQAGTIAPFTLGCSCITAEYTPNKDGSVGVVNKCQRFGRVSDIKGSASAVDAAYGDKGVFFVKLGGVPPIKFCPGPNYIVQEFDEEAGWAIVQAPKFSTLFLLSRKQNVPASEVDTWLAKAEALGSDLSKVIKTKQTGCKA